MTTTVDTRCDRCGRPVDEDQRGAQLMHWAGRPARVPGQTAFEALHALLERATSPKRPPLIDLCDFCDDAFQTWLGDRGAL